MKNFLGKLSTAFREQKIFYMLVLLFFCIGIVIGVYTVIYMDEVDKNDITSYFSTFINGMKNNSVDYIGLLLTVIKKNILIIVPIVLLSFTFFGAPIILIINLVKGFTLGYTFTFLLVSYNKKGLVLALASLIPQNIIYIPCIIILSVIGINLSANIFKDRFFRHISRKKIDLLKAVSNHIILVLGMYLLGILIETYLSPSIIKFVVTRFYI